MTLKHYFPISVGLFVLVVAAAYSLSVPMLPFAVLTLIGETLIGLELEDHRVPRVLKSLWGAAKPGHHMHT